MALMNCPECGNEVSNKAIHCPMCGCTISQNQKEYSIKPNNTVRQSMVNKKAILLVFAIVLLVICGAYGIIAGSKIINYKKAVALVEENNIDKAKIKFEKLGDYKDSATYVKDMTSKIDGVSDKAYYLGKKMAKKVSESGYRKELEINIKTTLDDNFDVKWDKIKFEDIKNTVLSSDFCKPTLDELSQIAGEGKNDQKFIKILEYYYYIICDNAFAKGVEQEGAECSTKYRYTCELLKYASEIDFSEDEVDYLVNLDSVIDDMLKELEKAEEIGDLNYITLVGTMTLFGIESDK